MRNSNIVAHFVGHAHILAGFAALASLVLLLALGPRIEPSLSLLGMVCLLVTLWLIYTYPAAFIAPLIFVGTLKPQAANGFSIWDWTFIATALLYGAVSLNVISVLAGADVGSLWERLRPQKAAILAFCVFTAIVVSGYFHSGAQQYATEKLLRFVVISSAALIAPLILLRREKDLRHLAAAMVLFGIVLSCKTLLGISSPEPRSVQGAIVHDITHIGPGQLLGMTLLILLFYRFSSGRIYKVAITLTTPLLAAALVVSAARGPILSFVLVLGCCLLISGLRLSLAFGKVARIAMLGVLAVTFIAALTWLEARPGAQQTLGRKTTELVQVINGSTAPSSTAGKRLEFYKAAVYSMGRNPLGIGLGGWSMFYLHGDQRAYPHNILLEIGSELGFQGLFSFLLLVGLAALGLRTIYLQAEQFRFLVPVFSFSLLVTMFSGDINDNRPLWMWFGVIFAVVRLAREQQQRPRVARVAHVRAQTAGSVSGTHGLWGQVQPRI